jgi:predicted kinase
VVVSGPPGSGKTTLAAPLARGLGLPLLAKDTIKEALMDSLDAGTIERSNALGRASFAVLFALARDLLDGGCGLVLEANFSRGRSEADLAPLVAAGRAVVVHCQAPAEVLHARYRDRAAERHPGHHDLARLAGPLPWTAGDPTRPPRLGDVPCLRVDTTRPVDLAAVHAWVLDHLAAE